MDETETIRKTTSDLWIVTSVFYLLVYQVKGRNVDATDTLYSSCIKYFKPCMWMLAHQEQRTVQTWTFELIGSRPHLDLFNTVQTVLVICNFQDTLQGARDSNLIKPMHVTRTDVSPHIMCKTVISTIIETMLEVLLELLGRSDWVDGYRVLYVNNSKEIIFEPVLEVKANCCLAVKKKVFLAKQRQKQWQISQNIKGDFKCIYPQQFSSSLLLKETAILWPEKSVPSSISPCPHCPIFSIPPHSLWLFISVALVSFLLGPDSGDLNLSLHPTPFQPPCPSSLFQNSRERKISKTGGGKWY